MYNIDMSLAWDVGFRYDQRDRKKMLQAIEEHREADRKIIWPPILLYLILNNVNKGGGQKKRNICPATLSALIN